MWEKEGIGGRRLNNGESPVYSHIKFKESQRFFTVRFLFPVELF